LRFLRTQAVREQSRIAWITDRNHDHRLIAFRDLTVFPRLIDSKACHLVRDQPERRGLDHKILYRHTRVMKRMTVRRAILELQLCHG